MAVNFTISAIIKAVDKITAPVAGITAKLNALTHPLKRVGLGMKAFADNTGITRLAKGFGSLLMVVGRVAMQVAALGAAMLALGGIGIGALLVSITKGFADAGDEVATTARKLNVTTQELQKMRYAGDMLDVSNETLDGGLKKLSRSITMASRGAKDQVKALRLLGYTDKEIRSGKISVMDATIRLSRRMEDEKKAKTNAIVANSLYGKSYLEMMPMLKEGGERIQALTKEAEELGLVMSNEAVEAAGAYDDATKRLNYSLIGLRNSIGSQLIPIITPLIDKMREWIASNRELIATKITDFIKLLSDVLKSTDWAKVADSITAIGKAFYYVGMSIYYVIEGFKVIGGVFVTYAGYVDDVVAKLYKLVDVLKSIGSFRLNNMFGGPGLQVGMNAPTSGLTGGSLAGAAVNNAKANVVVDFKNVPAGTRVDSNVQGKGLNLGVDVGMQPGGAF